MRHNENLKYHIRYPLTLATLKNKLRMKVMTVPPQSFLYLCLADEIGTTDHRYGLVTAKVEDIALFIVI